LIANGFSSGLPQLSHAFAQRLAEIAELAWPKDHQHDGQDDEQVSRLKSSHE
jgi:hypothetical protein